MRTNLPGRTRVARTLFVAVALALWAGHASALTPNYWHTSGSKILDANGTEVRIAGVNWYGFEEGTQVVQGLWAQDYRAVMNTVKSNGYNTIRLPFSNQMVERPIVPTNMAFYNSSRQQINLDLQGLNSLQILDKIVSYAGWLGLHIILDNHRSSADSADEGGLWYTAAFPESAWINDWQTLASRYLGNSTVIGFDLRNEPHNANSGGACWGCGTLTHDWQLAAQRGGNAVQSINPNLMIFVEGTDCYGTDCYWWGGNLEGVQSSPVVLNTPNHVTYSAHDYGPGLSPQPWFNGNTTVDSLDAGFTKFWGYLAALNIAPVWVGEFGTTNLVSDMENDVAGSQGQWFEELVAYLKNNPGIGWTYWALDGEDKYGLLDANYDATPANAWKQQLLASLQPPAVAGPPGLLFIPVTPCRVADTRQADGPFGGPAIAAASMRSFVIPDSSCGIPASAAAYSLNVTVVPGKSLGFLTIWPAGKAQPNVSTLNAPDGRVKANAAIVDAGTSGAVSVYVSDASNVVLDINGYFALSVDLSALAFYPATPCRIVDTRDAEGAFGGPFMEAGQTRSFDIPLSACNIPANAGAFSLNFTVVPHGTFAYLSTWPTGQAQPEVSTLNAFTGKVTANSAIVPAGSGGAISVYVTHDSDLVIDVNGYFAPPESGGMALYSLSPCRALDTRGVGDKQPFVHIRAINIAGSTCGVPATAGAIVSNATVVPLKALGFLSLWADGQTQPNVSTLNAFDGSTTSNLALIPTLNGSVDAYASDATQLILDISGYFAP